MAVNLSSIVTNGLVFNYDINNSKSYKGPTLTNHISGISSTVGSGTGYVLTGGTETVNIPELGETSVTFCNLQNTGESWCCVNFMNYGNAGNIFIGSTLYTYLILYRSDSGYTHPNWMYRYEYNISGTYQTEGGVHSTNNRRYLGNGWYYAWGTFTTQATTTNLTCYSFSYNYSSFNDKISVAKICIVPGNYSGLHPKYWPDNNTTRTNTQNIVDLTNNNTITATSLTYASDGTFSFNGTNNSLSTNINIDTTPALSPWTYEVWTRLSSFPTATTPNSYGITYRSGVLFGATYYSGAALYWYGNSSGNGCEMYGFLRGNDAYRNTSGFSMQVDTWYHFVMVNDYPNAIRLFVNGSQYGTTPCATEQYNPSLNAGNIGVSLAQIDGGGTANYSHYPGQVSIAKIYNRALSATEVLQNFNAQRGIYGL